MSQTDLLTLTEISKQPGISYQTLLRYVTTDLSRIPHEGSGRKKRYPPEATEVFEQIRAERSLAAPERTAPLT